MLLAMTTDESQGLSSVPYGWALLLHHLLQVIAGLLTLPVAAVAVALGHVVARDWSGISLGTTLETMVMFPVCSSFLYALLVWFVINRGDGRRGVVLSERQVFWTGSVSSVAAGAGWYALVARESFRGALIGVGVAVVYQAGQWVWGAWDRRHRMPVSAEEQAAKEEHFREVLRQTNHDLALDKAAKRVRRRR